MVPLFSACPPFRTVRCLSCEKLQVPGPRWDDVEAERKHHLRRDEFEIGMRGKSHCRTWRVRRRVDGKRWEGYLEKRSKQTRAKKEDEIFPWRGRWRSNSRADAELCEKEYINDTREILCMRRQLNDIRRKDESGRKEFEIGIRKEPHIVRGFFLERLTGRGEKYISRRCRKWCVTRLGRKRTWSEEIREILIREADLQN